MRVYRFNKQEHSELGFDGWLLVGAPATYYPLTGMGVAHDLLEHKADDNGSVEDELLALGGALWVRGEGGYWVSYTLSLHTPGENLVPDLCMLATQFGGIEGIQDPGRTTKLEAHVEKWIDEAIEGAREELVGEYDELDEKDVSKYLDNVRGWIRKGYRRTKKRYSAHSAGELAYLFHTIEKEADHLLKVASDYEQLVIRLDLRRCDVTLSMEMA